MRNGKHAVIFSTHASAALLMVLAAAAALPAQDDQSSTNTVTFTNLVNFDGTNGSYPYNWPLVQGIDGNLYGVTNAGGANGNGTLFKMTPQGSLSVLYNFCAQPNCTDGANPNSLALGRDGNLYGTTTSGGANVGGPCGGTFFKVIPTGVTTLYSFSANSEPSFPNGITLGADGNFYGTADCNAGSVFKITPEGTLTTLWFFSGGADGGYPLDPVIQGMDGDLYGTAQLGGASGGAQSLRSRRMAR